MDKRHFYGFLGSVSLTLVYLLITTLGGGPELFLREFEELWYLLIPLIAGFGLQVGLFSHVRVFGSGQGKKEAASAGSVSSGSMIACCAHHVTDVLPFLGLTAAALTLADYQRPLLLLGNLSNLVGTVWMLDIIQKHSIYSENSGFKLLEGVRIGAAKWPMAAVSIMIFAAYALTYDPTSVDVTKELSKI
jgi:hypothetical protein